MDKFGRIAIYEYRRHVLRRRFLLALLSVPALIAVMILVGLLIGRAHSSDLPTGYMDPSDFLTNPLSPADFVSTDNPILLIPFQNQPAAEQALQNREIQAYFLLSEDYLQTGKVKLIYIDQPSSDVEEQFRDFLRVNLLKEQPQPVVKRLINGSNLTVRTPDGRRVMAERDWINILVPFAAGFVFIIAIFTTSGYLMQAIVEEKENRTIEILMTSVSTSQMMGGKIVGIIGVGLTQIVVWLGIALLAVLIGRNYFEWLQSLHLSIGFIAFLVIVMLPSFVLIAALMAAIGATVTEAREGQQVTGLFTLPVMLPYWFVAQIMSNPNGTLAVALSCFPLTAPVALPMRAGFTSIPVGQVLLSLGILILSATGALGLAGRAFRLGMLRYGQRFNLRELLGRPKRTA